MIMKSITLNISNCVKDIYLKVQLLDILICGHYVTFLITLCDLFAIIHGPLTIESNEWS